MQKAKNIDNFFVFRMEKIVDIQLDRNVNNNSIELLSYQIIQKKLIQVF